MTQVRGLGPVRRTQMMCIPLSGVRARQGPQVRGVSASVTGVSQCWLEDSPDRRPGSSAPHHGTAGRGAQPWRSPLSKMGRPRPREGPQVSGRRPTQPSSFILFLQYLFSVV